MGASEAGRYHQWRIFMLIYFSELPARQGTRYIILRVTQRTTYKGGREISSFHFSIIHTRHQVPGNYILVPHGDPKIERRLAARMVWHLAY